MRAVIFAGGIGTRMWPVSRVKTPKQFSSMVGDQSTLELMYKNLQGYLPSDHIYVGTNQDYVNLVKAKLPKLSDDHVFREPAMRDLGPAVGYALLTLHQQDPLDPVAILWSDDLIKKPKVFHKILAKAEDYLKENPDQLVYIGVEPLFADQNKGWIHFGKALKHFNGISMYQFKDWHYRPPMALAKQFFKSGKHAINTGYFVSTPKFIMKLYEEYAPEMYQQLKTLTESRNTSKHDKMLSEIYPQLEKISFDDLIIQQTSADQAVVLIGDMGWYGFGDWEAMKEALQSSPGDVVAKGQVVDRNSHDSLIYNYSKQLVTTIDLEGMLVVVTDDVVMVCRKESVPEIKKMLKDFQGTKFERYT